MLDSGNLLFKAPPSPATRESALIKAEGIASAYLLAGYQAVAVSPTDLLAGKDFFSRQSQQPFPWISANVVDDAGIPAFPPYIITKLGHLNVAVIALTRKGGKEAGDYRVLDWKPVLEKQLAELSSRCDFIILLSNLKLADNKAITANYPQVQVIITSDKTRGNVVAHPMNDTIFTQVGSRGKYLGRLKINWSGKGKFSSRKQHSSTNSFRSSLLPVPPNVQSGRAVGIVTEIDKELKEIASRKRQ